MAISVGSVEVDVVPNTRGIYRHLSSALVPAAARAGEDAGSAAGNAFGPAMRSAVGNVGTTIGQQIGQQAARRITAEIRDALRDGITQGGRTARPAAARQGDQAGGAFSRALKTRLEAAFRSLPDITIDADTSEADADLQALRVRMETLSRQHIGIDIEAGAAKAEIRLIEAELTRLGASHPNVQVRADTAAARAQLAAVRADIAAVDGRRININTNVDTRQARRALLALSVAIAGVAAIPAIPVAAAGIGAITSAAVAAGAGVGALAAVAIPAFSGIKGALDAQKAAQEAATSATQQGGQAAARASQRALQMAGAQQALASAERNGARQIAQAHAQVRQARQAAADAAAQAAVRQAQAARAIEDAERSLTDAQRDARQAQQDLNEARRDAARDLEDLANRATSAQLSQRDAALSVTEAQADLARVQADAGASDIDRARAQLAYEQAVQRLREQRLETKRLTKEQAAASKAGVAGSERVLSAQQRLAAAQRTVADRARAVRDAQAEAARVQTQTSRQVVAAQQRVGEATRNVAVAQQAAADAVSSAQRQIQAAQMSAAGGADAAATAQAKYQAALAKLTPAARGTLNAFVGLRTAFSAWSKSLQPTVMPIFTRALNGLKSSLPGLTPFVLAAARGIEILQDKVSRGFDSPWWKSFKTDLAGSVQPAIVGLGTAFGNVFKGMAGIVQAFLPHMDSISRRMGEVTGRFADWGTSLKGSPEFEGFLAYSSRMAPLLGESLGKVADAFLQVAKALEPLSGPILRVLGELANGIATIAEHAPWLVQGLYLAIIATKLWTLALAALGFVMRQLPIVRIIIIIAALVAAVIYAYNNFGWFRTAVDAAWAGIRTAALWAWNTVLKPVFNAIWSALKVVGAVAMWLWKKAIKPALAFIWKAFKVLAVIITVVVLGPIILGIQALGRVVSWLWRVAIGPAVRAIGAVFKWLWRNAIKPVWEAIRAQITKVWNRVLKPVFDAIRDYVKNTLGPRFKWLWKYVIKPVWDAIRDKVTDTWRNKIRPAFDALRSAVGKVGDAFGKARDAIKKAWDKVSGIAKKPIKFIIDQVYNKGIVGVWNKVAGAFGAPKLDTFKLKGWATGGYTGDGATQTPAGIVHAGEYVTRKASTARIQRNHPGVLDYMNRTGKLPGYAKGGIVGDGWDWIKDTGSAAWEKVKAGASWLKDGIKASALAGMNRIVKPLISKISGSASLYKDMVTGIPKKMLRSIFDYSGEADKKLTEAGVGGPGVKAALRWARTQVGKPYLWGGVGPRGYDCSGFMSAIQRRIQGKNPHSRMWATGAFPPGAAGWKRNLAAPFRVGITNSGVGHTAGTIAGVNVESRGGDGVVVGRRARGYKSGLFSSRWGFAPSRKYDSGGYLQPGMNLAYNGTGRPEPVFTAPQADALLQRGTTPAAAEGSTVNYYVYPRKSVIDRNDLALITRREQAQARLGRPR